MSNKCIAFPLRLPLNWNELQLGTLMGTEKAYRQECDTVLNQNLTEFTRGKLTDGIVPKQA